MTDRKADTRAVSPGRGDDDFASTAGRMLRESAEDLDAATASRLHSSRQAALDRMPGRETAPVWRLPALATAALAVLAVALWVSPGAGPGGTGPGGSRPGNTGPATPVVTSAADIDLLLAGDSLEMLEDLEFYEWLDADLSDDGLRVE